MCGSIVSWFFFWRYIGVDGVSCFLSVLVFDCFKYCIEKVFVFSFYKFAVFPGCHFLCDCNLLLIGEFYVTNAWCNVLVDILLSAVVGFYFFAPVYLFSWYDFIISYVCMIVFFRIRFCNFRESCYFGEVFWIVVFSATGIVIVLRSYLIVFCCVHVLILYLFVSPCVFLCFLSVFIFV